MSLNASLFRLPVDLWMEVENSCIDCLSGGEEAYPCSSCSLGMVQCLALPHRDSGSPTLPHSIRGKNIHADFFLSEILYVQRSPSLGNFAWKMSLINRLVEHSFESLVRIMD